MVTRFTSSVLRHYGDPEDLARAIYTGLYGGAGIIAAVLLLAIALGIRWR